MASLNKVTLIGNLGGDPEIRRMQSGKPVATFNLAMSESWKDRDTGEKKQATEWMTVTCFSEGLCAIIEQYLSKGSKVYVEGKLQTRTWEKDGVKHYKTEVVLQNFNGTIIMLGDGRSGSEDEGQRRSSAAPRRQSASRARPEDDPLDDEIPF